MPLFDADEVVVRRREDSHVAQLEYERERNRQRIALLEERNGKIDIELDEIRAKREKRPIAEPGVRTIGEPEHETGSLQRSGKDRLEDTRLRDGIVRLGAFTIPELAAMLKVKPGTVRQHQLFKSMCDESAIVNLDERHRGQPRYEYVKPEEPGKAFEVSQASAPPPPEPSDPIVGTGNNPLLNALDKSVRTAARAGIRDGWELRQTGSGHYELTRDGFRSIPISGTPRNASDEANHVRQRLRTARPITRARAAAIPARGRPIPHTGRTPGTSGKPGRDRKVAKATGRQPKKRRET